MGKVAFKQADLRRVIRAYVSEGLAPPRVKIDRDGNMDVIPLPSAAPANQDDDLDAEMREWRLSHGEG